MKILRFWILILSKLSAIAWRSQKAIAVRMTCRFILFSLFFLFLCFSGFY
jgi:hypothetical protein